MKATKLLPVDYVPRGSIDFARDKQLALGLGIVGTVLLFVFGLFFFKVATALILMSRPPTSIMLTVDLGFFIWLLLIQLLVAVLHELTHGAFFWLFTRERPRFGFSLKRLYLVYAYAAAPDWYVPRTQYMVVTAAPFVLLSLVGLAFFPLIPVGVAPALVVALTLNAAGCVGDLYVVLRLLLASPSCLAHDVGHGMVLYEPLGAGEGVRAE